MVVVPWDHRQLSVLADSDKSHTVADCYETLMVHTALHYQHKGHYNQM